MSGAHMHVMEGRAPTGPTCVESDTAQAWTPGMALTTRSILPEHAAHDMPPTASVNCCRRVRVWRGAATTHAIGTMTPACVCMCA